MANPNPKNPNPPHVPTDKERRTIIKLLGSGFTQAGIADVLEISETCLKKYYSETLRNGRQKAHAHATGKLWQLIENGNPGAVIFYHKTQMGWRETDRLEHVGVPGQPIEHIVEQRSAADLVRERLDTIRRRREVADEKPEPPATLN